MRYVPLVAGVALAACSQPARQEGAVDLNSAAAHAQQDIDNYAAATPAPNVSPAAGGPVAPPPSAPAPNPSPSASPVASADADAAAAAAVVRRYFGLIDAGKYGQARQLWRDGGQGSGKTAAAFAAQFAPYISYKATVGKPYDEDAGAGQRYITVPASVVATRKTGGVDRLNGTLILHRAAEGIETDDPTDHEWRIDRTTIAASGAGPAARAVVTASYHCDGGVRFAVRFDNRADTASLDLPRRAPVTLQGQRPASGIWYAGDGFELRGKGDAATLTRPAAAALSCTAIG